MGKSNNEITNISKKIKDVYEIFKKLITNIDKLTEFGVKLTEHIEKNVYDINELIKKFKSVYAGKLSYYKRLFTIYDIYFALKGYILTLFDEIISLSLIDAELSETSLLEIKKHIRKLKTQLSIVYKDEDFDIQTAEPKDYNEIIDAFKKINSIYSTNLLIALNIQDKKLLYDLKNYVFDINEKLWPKNICFYKIQDIKTYSFEDICKKFNIKAKNMDGFIKLYKKPIVVFDKRYNKSDIYSYKSNKLLDEKLAEYGNVGINEKIINRYKTSIKEKSSTDGYTKYNKLHYENSDLLYIETDGFIYKYEIINPFVINSMINKYSEYNKYMPFYVPSDDVLMELSDDYIETIHNKILNEIRRLKGNIKLATKFEKAMNTVAKQLTKDISVNSSLNKEDIKILLESQIIYVNSSVKSYLIQNRINKLDDARLLPYVREFLSSIEGILL